VEKSSGGLSSLFDRDGNDWIDFSQIYDGQFPFSAAADYRGIPNIIYKQKLDNGTGHPGFATIKKSEIISKNEIQFESKHGFEFTWKFTDNYAKLSIDKTIPEQKYWILYEGVIGGKYQPLSCYWGTDKGMRTDTPNFLTGKTVEGNWQWAYFGNKNQDRVMFIKQEEPYSLSDIMGYMSAFDNGLRSHDGMVVFGLGRDLQTNSLLEDKNSFYFGFYENSIDDENDYEELVKYLEKNVK